MSNEQHLSDPEWGKEREKKWNDYADRWLKNLSPCQYEARKKYFFSGNVSEYIENVESKKLSVVISNTPLRDATTVIHNISHYWHWVLENPEARDEHERFSSLNERFLNGCYPILSNQDDNISPELCVELFYWLYGESYSHEQNRLVTLNYLKKTENILVNFNINNSITLMISGIAKCLWYKNEGENIRKYRSLISYFLTLYPHMSPIFFERKLPKKDKVIDDNGNVYYMRYWIWNRWLLSLMNGFISEFEEDEGIDSLTCNDERSLLFLKNGLGQIKMPQSYYDLQEFVLKNKGDSLFLSQ